VRKILAKISVSMKTRDVGHTYTEEKGKIEYIGRVLSIIQSFTTIVAIFVAGFWFLFKGEGYQKANIVHSVSHFELNQDWTWVNLDIKIDNVGTRRLDLNYSDVRIQHVIPLEKSLKSNIENGNSIISVNTYKIPWPT
jgi:hypothetical protein